MKINLNNRTIDDNGKVIFDEQGLIELLYSGWQFDSPISAQSKEVIESFNMLSKQYNTNKTIDTTITNPLNEWYYPLEYNNIDLAEFFAKKLSEKYSTVEDRHVERVITELELFEQHGLTNLLRFLIYFVDVLTQKDIIWGVGRGSSVSSFLLFLTGLHMVDCVKFNIPISEFIHD